jgi:hypothetical protein
MPPSAHRLTRKALYDLVWSEPVSKIAPRYAISDVGFAKLCRRIDVPLPPRGYWAKLKFGKRIRRPPLKPRDNPKDETVVIAEHQQPAFPPDIATAIAYERSGEARIEVPKIVAKWHPIVQKGFDHEAERSRWDGSRPKVTAIERQRRVLLTVFLRALERRSWSVTDDERKGFAVKMLGQAITFDIMEITKRVPHKKDTRPGAYDWGPTYDHEPTGMLRLRLHKSYYGSRDWNGTAERPLEARLNDVIVGFLEQAARDRKRDEELAEQHRRWEEERRLREEAEERARRAKAKVDKLVPDASRWETASRIRSYVLRAEKVGRAPISDEQTIEEWVAWALSVAESMDPTS